MKPFARTSFLALFTLTALACSSPSGGPDAGEPDSGVIDSGTPDAGMPGTTCGVLLLCDQHCSGPSTCTDGCFSNATAIAQGLFLAFDDCIDGACSQTCASMPTDCDSCNRTAATSTCIGRLGACMDDNTMGPANGDAGPIFPDAGTRINCGTLVACTSSCPAADGGACTAACAINATVSAQGLANALQRCLDTTCPTSGVCATHDTTCEGCITQSEFDNNTCGTQFNACETDSSNTGDAGVVPVALQGGTITVLSRGLDQPQSVLVQNGYVYFSEVSDHATLRKVSLADGGETVFATQQPYPMGLAVDSNNFYAVNSGSFSGQTNTNQNDGTVVQFPLDGGASLTLASQIELAYTAPYINGIAVDATHVYWVQGAVGDDGKIMACPIGVAAPVVLYDHLSYPEAVVTDGTNLYWTSWGTFNAQGQSNNDGTVMQGSIDGGAVISLATNQSAPAAIAIDSTNVYWTNAGRLGAGAIPASNTGSVNQVPIGGGTLVPLATSQPVSLGIAVAGSHVYYAAYTLTAPGQIIRVPVGGGALLPILGGLADPFALTVSGNTLYWSDSPPTAQGSGMVLSLSPLP